MVIWGSSIFSETLSSNISNTPAANPHRHGPWLHHLDVIQGDAEVGSVMGILDLFVKNREVLDLLLGTSNYASW